MTIRAICKNNVWFNEGNGERYTHEHLVVGECYQFNQIRSGLREETPEYGNQYVLHQTEVITNIQYNNIMFRAGSTIRNGVIGYRFDSFFVTMDEVRHNKLETLI